MYLILLLIMANLIELTRALAAPGVAGSFASIMSAKLLRRVKRAFAFTAYSFGADPFISTP